MGAGAARGLADGRWALGWKTHHCLVDGVGSVDIVDLMLDSEPNPERPEEREASGGRSEHAPAPDAGDRHTLPPAVVQATEAGADVAMAGLHAIAHPVDALARSRALAELIVRDEIIGAPQSSLNVPIGQTRRYGVVRVPLAELKAIRHELGGSVNDVVLAILPRLRLSLSGPVCCGPRWST